MSVRRVLLANDQTLRVVRVPGEAGVFSFLDDLSASDARRYLQEYIHDHTAIAQLRMALAEDSLGMPVNNLDDAEVLDEAAHRIAMRHLFLAEELDEPTPQLPEPEAPGSSAPAELPRSKKLTWIELEVINDETGLPLNSVRIVVKAPDGEENFHTTNSEGVIRIEDIESGSCDARCETKDARRKDTLRFLKVGKWGGKKADKPTPIKAATTYRILEITDHEVKDGETMASLASGAGLSEPALSNFNFDTDKTADLGKSGIVLLPKKWEQAGLATGSRHTLLLKPIPQIQHVWILELEELHYHHDSAVMLADYDTEDPNPDMEPKERVTALCVLAEALAEAKRNPNRKVLLAGHTDTSGGPNYNLTLSQQRADGALAALMGDKTKWVQIALAKHKVEDYQLILKWVARDWGWEGCDPGAIDNKDGPKTKDATKAFQQRYNKDFKKKIGEDGVVGQETWGAFFDVYMTELRELADCDDDAALDALRKNIKFVDDGKKSVGCGENFPKENRGVDGWRSRENRRVEILFFEKDNLPVMDCHKGPCKAAVCQVNDPKVFIPELLPVDPVLPRFARLRMHMQLLWADPEKKEHPFPKDTPLFLVYDTGGTPVKVTLAENGVLDTFLDRRRQAVKLMFDFTASGANLGVQYLGTPPPPSGGGDAPPDMLVKEADLQKAIDEKNRLWRLPDKWTTVESDWAATDAATFEKGKFTQLSDQATQLGTHATPGKLLLDPHWKGIRVEFFDRFFVHSDHANKSVCVPSIMLEGFRADPAAAKKPPDSHSNWSANDADAQKMSLCLPWVLRHKDDGSADLPNLDKTMLIRFAAEKKYVFSKSATEREIKTLEPTADDLKPKGARLKLYDLPKLWKSSKYFTRLPGATGKFFQDLTDAEIGAADDLTKPLTFSLDDIILTDDKLKPIKLADRSATDKDHICVFSHLFDKDPADAKVGDYGVYDADATEPYFTKDALRLTTDLNYIADYPAWPRLVIALGSFFDAFDQRTPDGNDVVGARAAVRWVDQVAAGVAPGNTLTPRPARTKKDFYAIQPFFEQEYIGLSSANLRTGLSTGTYDFVNTPDIPGSNRTSVFKIGRYDIGVLRCCDAEGDDEKAVSLQYFRFSFDFSGAPTPHNTNAANQATYRKDTCANIPKRWNGPETGAPSPLNNGPAVAESSDTPKLKVKVMWFAQSLPKASAHFDLKVVSNAGRSFMASDDGTGELRISANNVEPARGAGTLVAAHECGHGGTLPDEYVETSTQCSYMQAPVRSNNVPGDPFDLDPNGMMSTNKQIRGRYYWHVAEWLRALYGSNWLIRHDSMEYKVPQHPQWAKDSATKAERGFNYWPLKADVNTANGASNFDVYYYALGLDRFSKQGIKSGAEFDGMILIQVKLQFTFPVTASHSPGGTFGRIRSDLATLQAQLDTRFNRRWKAAGTVGGTAFSNAAIQFSFRYLVPTITNEGAAGSANQKYLTDNGGSVSGYGTLVTRLSSRWDVHINVNVRDSGATSSRTGSTISLRSDEYASLDTFIAQALGMSTAAPSSGPFPDSAQLLPLVGKVMTGATISNF